MRDEVRVRRRVLLSAGVAKVFQPKERFPTREFQEPDPISIDERLLPFQVADGFGDRLKR